VYQPRTNMIVPHVMQHLDLLECFLSRVYDEIDEALAREIRDCLMKVFALHSGTHLAYLYLSQAAAGSASGAVTDLDQELARGV